MPVAAMTTGRQSEHTKGLPKAQTVPLACDCHFHIYNQRFATDPKANITPPDALVADYTRLRDQLGLTRGVVVNPSTYGVDNSCTLDALAQLGPSYRGVGVVDASVTDAELARLHAGGICGIRFNLLRPGATTVEMIAPLAERVAHLGWHIQVHMAADEIYCHADLLANLPVPVVFDHLGRIPYPTGPMHPAHRFLLKQLDTGRTWVKLSGPYHESRIGPPSYSDAAYVARAYIAAAPDRVIWGSDWPHPTPGAFGPPDDQLLFDLAAEWASDTATWRRILVDNPSALYGFGASIRCEP
jgi:D-galactarolactone isomerase